MLSYEAANGFMKNLEKKSSGASQAKPAHSAEPETEFDFFKIGDVIWDCQQKSNSISGSAECAGFACEAPDDFFSKFFMKPSGASQAKPMHSAEPETEFDFRWQSQITLPILKKIVKTLEYRVFQLDMTYFEVQDGQLKMTS